MSVYVTTSRRKKRYPVKDVYLLPRFHHSVPFQNTNHRFTQLSVLSRCQIVKVQKWAESTHTHTAQFLNSVTLQSELAARSLQRHRHPSGYSGHL